MQSGESESLWTEVSLLCLWAKPTVPGSSPHPAAWVRFSAGNQALSSDAWLGMSTVGTGSLPLQHPVQVRVKPVGFLENVPHPSPLFTLVLLGGSGRWDPAGK